MRLLLCLLLAALPVAAQFSSAIQGTVTDATQATVPDATITVTNTATGVVRSVTTSAEGFYRISNLGPGTYNVKVEKAGFSGVQREGVALAITDISRVDFTLSVGAVAEQVQVVASAPLVETEQGRVSGRIDRSQLAEMPLNGRNIMNLIGLQPGINGRGISSGLGAAGGGSDSFAGENGPQVHASGQRWESNNYTVDDTSTNGLARNGTTSLTPNAESVEEIRITANNFSAVEGRNPGAQVQVTTKAGTNIFHGTASFYHQNNALASRNVFEAKVPVVRKNQFGYSIGGPIIKNRTFFFHTYEGLRQSGARAQTYSVETPEFRDFVLSTRPNSIAAKLLREFAPAASPTKNFIDRGSPLPGVTRIGPADGVLDIGSVDYVNNSFRNGGQQSIRLDHELRPGVDKIYGSFFRTNVVTQVGGVRPAFDRPTDEWTYFGNINYTHIFSANKINEFRVGLIQLNGRPRERPFQEIPQITVTSLSGFGGGQYPAGWWQTSYHYKDIFSWIRSTHTVKVGGEIRRMRSGAQNTANYIPSYSFNDILDFADDEALQQTRQVDPTTGIPVTSFGTGENTEWAVFINDDWKVNRKLTLNLGLRYDRYGSQTDRTAPLRNLQFGPGATYIERLATAKLDYVDELFPTDMLNFAPRLGFAWDPFGRGKMTVRGGYGIAYDRVANGGQNAFGRATVSLGQNFGTAFTYSLGDPAKPFLGYPVEPAAQRGLDSRGGIIGTRISVNSSDPGNVTPYVQNWFVGIQREIARNTTVEANYIGAVGHHLHNQVDVNRFNGDMLDGRFDGINPSFSNIIMRQNTSNSTYHGGTLTLRRAFSAGYNLQAAYTFGKAIDDTDQSFDFAAWQNAYNRAGEKGLAGFNAPHKLTIVGLWEVPLFRTASGWKRRVLSGWQLSGFAILQAGTPNTVTNFGSFPRGDYNADNTAQQDRPNAPAPGLKMSGWSRQDYLTGIFKVSDFTAPAPGTDGNLGRNTIPGPGFAQTDLSLAKTFTLTERVSALLRVDAFNAFNRVNLGNPATGNAQTTVTLDLANPAFGKSTTAFTPRVYQLGLKIQF